MDFIFRISSANILSSLANLTCCLTKSCVCSKMELLFSRPPEFYRLAGCQQFNSQYIFQILQYHFQFTTTDTSHAHMIFCPRDVGILSALAGKHRVLFSVTSAAVVYWGIMNPLFSPTSFINNSGRPHFPSSSK